MSKIFKIIKDIPEIKDEVEYKRAIKDNPENILNEYAEMVASDTDDEFIGRVYTTTMEDTDEIIYAFYIASSVFGDLMYRLIEVTQKNIAAPYPSTITFNTLNMEHDETLICADATQMKKKIENYVQSDDTGMVLGYLDKLVKIRNYERSKSA